MTPLLMVILCTVGGICTRKQYIYFSVTDLDSTFEKAKSLRCKRVDEAIKTMPWGERFFYAKDPFNNPICFVDEATVFRG